MAFNYNISWTAFARIMTPINKRLPIILAYIQVQLSQVAKLHTRLFTYFYPTADYDLYSGSETYSIGDVIQYGYGVYECLVDGISGITPTNTDNWLKLQSNHIGVFERGKIKGGKISLEKYLNKFYGTAFNYPSSANEIYITTNDNDLIQLYSSDKERTTCTVTNTWAQTRHFTGDDFNVYSQNNFTIYIPSAVWMVIDSTDVKREANVKNLISIYIPAGVQFNATSY